MSKCDKYSRFFAKIVFLLFIVASVQLSTAKADDPNQRSGRIRAALLYYIAKFVELSPPQNRVINICLVGEDPMEPFLASTVQGKFVREYSLETQTLQKFTKEFASSCSLVFFGNLYDEELKSSKEALQHWTGLSVCAEDIAAKLGLCVIRLFNENNKARIAVNRDRANKNKLIISSELLDVALLE